MKEIQILEGFQLIEELKRRNTLPSNPSIDLIHFAKEFDEAYENICLWANEILNLFVKKCIEAEIKIGTCALCLVGGRVNGKPLNLNSDIDYIFLIENIDVPIYIRNYNKFKYKFLNLVLTEIETIFRKYSKIEFEFKGIWSFDESLQNIEDGLIFPIAYKLNKK